MRAFLNRHVDMLQDPSRWPVPHFVEQLAAQEPDSTFARAGCAVKVNSTMMGKIIERVKRPRVQHPLRLTLNSRGEVRALAFSPEGARLAQAVDDNVVVSDSTTGFTLSTLSCDDTVFDVSFSQDGQHIAAACRDGGVYIFSLNQQSRDWEIRSECPLRGHRYVPSLSRECFLSCFRY